MKNIHKIILIIIIFSTCSIYSQKDTFSVSWTKTTLDKDFDISKVYNKGTRVQISKKEFGTLVRENPNLFLEREINETGNVVRYLYDPKNPNSNGKLDMEADTSVIGSFANFNLTTIDGTKIELSKLNGKMVILRFELSATDFHFKKQEIQKLDEQLNELGNTNTVEAIIIFQCSENDVRAGFDLQHSNFELVANGKILWTNMVYPVIHLLC